MSKWPRRRHLPLVALLGAAAAVLPSLAVGDSSGSVQAQDDFYMPQQLAITPGGTVTFSEGGKNNHDVHFDGPLPDSCTNNSAAVTSAVGPSSASATPPVASSQAWSSTCSFSQPGTYTFFCDVHHFRGTVYVNAAGTVPSTTTTTPPPTTTTGGGTPPPTTTATTTTPPPGGGGGGGAAGGGGSGAGAGGGAVTGAGGVLGSVAVAGGQRGAGVRGSVEVDQGGSSLTVELQAPSASLAGNGRSKVVAGHLQRHGVGPGRVSFTVSLNARARRALTRHRRLVLTVRIRVTAPSGAAATSTRRVTLRR